MKVGERPCARWKGEEVVRIKCMAAASDCVCVIPAILGLFHPFNQLVLMSSVFFIVHVQVGYCTPVSSSAYSEYSKWCRQMQVILQKCVHYAPLLPLAFFLFG